MTRISMKTSEKMTLIGNLATMLTSGIPILEAVDSLLEDTKGSQKKILEVLKEDLVQGRRVYTTFAKFPNAFDKVTVNVIRAAEEAGTLDVALKDLRENIKRDEEFTSKIRSALIYPLFVFGIFFAVLLLILFVVVPKIATVFKNIRVELPLPTRILIFISDLLVARGPLILVLTIALGVLLVFLFRTYKKVFLSFFFSLPLISGVIFEIDLTRFSRSLYLLLGSGIPITHALELTEDVVLKAQSQQIIRTAREMVLAGKSLTSALKVSKNKIPNLMIKLIEAGEKTGTLEKSMQEITDHFDYQVTNKLKTMTSLIEPVMLVLVGLIVGGMMLSIIAPIYGLIGKVGAR